MTADEVNDRVRNAADNYARIADTGAALTAAAEQVGAAITEALLLTSAKMLSQAAEAQMMRPVDVMVYAGGEVELDPPLELNVDDLLAVPHELAELQRLLDDTIAQAVTVRDERDMAHRAIRARMWLDGTARPAFRGDVQAWIDDVLTTDGGLPFSFPSEGDK